MSLSGNSSASGRRAAGTGIHVVGSMMIDRVVRVQALPRAGETVAALEARTFAGGKGANQAAAAAKCGARVRMLGRTGRDGAFIRDALEVAGVCVRHVEIDDPVAGAATVMVAGDGQNAIVIAPESNLRITGEDIERFLGRAKAGDIVLLQNECSMLHEGIALASARALRVWLNAAPSGGALEGLRMEKLAGLVVNETEAEALSGESDPRRALEALARQMPGGTVVVTLGAQGAIAAAGAARHEHRGFVVDAVDTVGCGDAFVGALLAAIADGRDIAQALARGNAAGALAAMRVGAMRSLPVQSEVDVASALPEGTRLKQRPPGEDEGLLPPRCTRCDYDLHGKGEGEPCPECGHIVRRFLFPGAWANLLVRRKFIAGGRWATIAILPASLAGAGLGLGAVGWASGFLVGDLQRVVVLVGVVCAAAFALASLWSKWLLAAGLPEPRVARAMKAVAISGMVCPAVGIGYAIFGSDIVGWLPFLPRPRPIHARFGISWWLLVELAYLVVLARTWRLANFGPMRVSPIVLGVLGALLAFGGTSLHEGHDRLNVAMSVPATSLGALLLWASVVAYARELVREVRARQ